MYEYILFLILFLTLTVSALLLAAAGIICRRCRREQREKERCIMQAVREQERLVRELEHMRSEKQRLERVLTARLPAWNTVATTFGPAGAPTRFHTPYNPVK